MLGPDELPVEVVDPGVVGALEADGTAAVPFLDRGAPVAAHVVERADHVVPAAHQEHALVEHLAHEEASPGSGTSSARATAIQSRRMMLSCSQSKTAGSW